MDAMGVNSMDKDELSSYQLRVLPMYGILNGRGLGQRDRAHSFGSLQESIC